MKLLGPWSQAEARPWWSRVDPRLKVALLVSVALLAVTLNQPRSLLPVLTLSFVLFAQLRLSASGWRTTVLLVSLIVWGTVFSQSLFYADRPRSTLFTLIPSCSLWGYEWSGLRIYREGVWHGLLQSMRLLAVTLTGLSVALSTGPERLLSVLSRFRPLSGLSFAVMAAVRFLPTALQEWYQVRQARRLRSGRLGRRRLRGCPESCALILLPLGEGGRRPDEGGARSTIPAHLPNNSNAPLPHPAAAPPSPGGSGALRRPLEAIRDELTVVEPVLAASLRRARFLATSASARGFDPAARRTAWPELSMRWWERVVFVLIAIVTLMALTGRLALWAYDEGLVYHSYLRAIVPWLREGL